MKHMPIWNVKVILLFLVKALNYETAFPEDDIPYKNMIDGSPIVQSSRIMTKFVGF
jgi:hypothetical protein